MILGVSLVVQELNKGPRLLFRYPEEGSSYYKRTFQLAVESGTAIHANKKPTENTLLPQPRTKPTVQVVSAPTADSGDDEEESAKSGKINKKSSSVPTAAAVQSRKTKSELSPCTLQQSTAATKLNHINEQYFGLSDENFAKLFRAKNALMGKKLDFSIGDLRFIALPCSCPVSPAVGPGLSSSSNTNIQTTKMSEETKESTVGTLSLQPPSFTGSTSINNSVCDVISSFHIVIATVSRDAMMEIQKDFIFRCQCRSPTLPGEDPIAAALGLRTKLTGVCSASILRILERASNLLLEEEKKSRYLTREISQILHIIDAYRHDASRSIQSTHLTTMQELPIDAGEKTPTSDGVDYQHNVIAVEFSRSRRSSSSHTNPISVKERDSITSDIVEMNLDREPSRESEKRVSSAPSSILASSVLSSNPTRFLCHHILMESTLANELKTLFHSITDNHATVVRFNGNCHKGAITSLVCNDVALCADSQSVLSKKGMLSRSASLTHTHTLTFRAPSVCAHVSHIYLTSNNTHTTPLPVVPQREPEREVHGRLKGVALAHQTLLLLGDADTVSNTLKAIDGTHPMLSPSLSQQFSSPSLPVIPSSIASRTVSLTHLQRLVNFLEAADPTQSFFDLSLTLDEPIEELLSMAHNLQGWGLAEVVPTISADRVYQVHPQAPLSAHSRVAKAFEALVLSFDVSAPLHALAITQAAAMISTAAAANPQRKRSASYTAPSPSTSLSAMSSHLAAASAAQLIKRADKEREREEDEEARMQRERERERESVQNATAWVETKLAKNMPPNAIKTLSQSTEKDKEKSKDTQREREKDKSSREIAMDSHSDVPAEYSLPRILSLFDGQRSLQEVVQLFPAALQDCSLYLVVLLLRYHMLLPVHSRLSDLFSLDACERELCDPEHAVNRISPSARLQLELDRERESQQRERERERERGSGRRPRKDSDVGFALSDSERSLDIDSLIARATKQHERRNSKDRVAVSLSLREEHAFAGRERERERDKERETTPGKSMLTDNLLAKERESSFLHNAHSTELTTEEKHALEKLAPFVLGSECSAKTVSEILLSTKLSERELHRLLQKLPYLQRVKTLL